MSSHLRFNDEEDDFVEFSSEDEKKLAKYKNSRRQEESDSEVEVYGVGSDNDSDSDDNQSDIALSDVEGQEDDDNLPDVRAWGKTKKKYYGTDYVDQDYGGFEGRDAHAAEIEEEEVKNLQSQLMQQLDDNDFSLDLIFKKSEKQDEKDKTEELIKTDLSKLSSKQKLQILKKEAPEFFALADDFKAKMSLAKSHLKPIIQKVKEGSIAQCKAVDFVQLYYHLILNYATNVYMYLLIKGSNKLKNHPVIQRLYQYRQLLGQMEPVFEAVIRPQIDILLTESKQEEVLAAKKKPVLKLLAQLQKREQTKAAASEGPPMKMAKIDKRSVTFKSDSSDSDESDKEEAENVEEIDVNALNSEEVSKRAITYQIAKNKGLTPYRKKENRNPRVKHKLKYRKALIRRKGARKATTNDK